MCKKMHILRVHSTHVWCGDMSGLEMPQDNVEPKCEEVTGLIKEQWQYYGNGNVN